MSSHTAVESSIAEAEKRADAIQVLIGILVGQVRAERLQLERIKLALAQPSPGPEPGGAVPAVDTALEMLAG
jgi:hypothetical protein